MKKLKSLNDSGNTKFKRYIVNLKENKQVEDLKINAINYEEIDFPSTEITINEEKEFDSKFSLGKYLYKKFIDVDKNKLFEKPGIWNWLTYIWFEQLCPKKNGERKIHEISRYIYDKDFQRYYRHIALSSWAIYDLHRDYSVLLLYSPLDTLSDTHEQLASSQDILTNKNLIKVAYKLYWDEENQKLKYGATSRNRKGNIRRLKQISYQLELTYDLRAMSVENIISLLPEEFNNWKSS